METWHRHPTEEVLEEYSLERLSEAELAPLEEHLLVCETCQAKLQEIDRFIRAMKVAAPELGVPRPLGPMAAPGGRLAGWLNWLRGRFPVTPGRAALAGAMALLCAVAVVDRPRAPKGSPVSVTLRSLRGGEIGSATAAPAGQPLRLSLEVPDQSGCAPCRVEIVSDSGRPVWSGEPSFSDGRVSITAPAGLSAGVYWVRLYNGGTGPEREFGLRLK